MAFKVPEQYRFNEKTAKGMAFLGENMKHLVLEDAVGNNGYFYLPKNAGSKGQYFVIKALEKDGWDCIAAYVPSEYRAPRYEELFYIKTQFWGPQDVIMMFFPDGDTPFIASPGWVHLWRSQDVHAMSLPPIYDEKFHFKKQSFWKKLLQAILKGENRK